MKKFVVVLFVICVSVAVLTAQPANEEKTVNLAVMQGPTGFSSVMLPEYVNISVYPSPNEAVAKLVSGELDMAVIPANTAANLYNKGVNIKFVAIVGEGMLSMVGTNENSATIAVPGAGGTPDHMATLLYPQYERNYSVSAPAQLAQLLIAGKCELAILPQPFVSMVLNKNSNVKILDDVQAKWAEKTGTAQYPMSVLVANEDFAENNSKVVNSVKNDYKKSIEKVIQFPSEAAQKIEEVGIMKANLAEPAIASCALVYKDGKKAVEELESYYEILLNLAPAAIGNKLPDSFLYK